MMTLEQAEDILRSEKFKATRPTDKKKLPMYMQSQNDERIDEYYNDKEKTREALQIAITSLNAVKNLKTASYDLVDLFENMDSADKK